MSASHIASRTQQLTHRSIASSPSHPTAITLIVPCAISVPGIAHRTRWHRHTCVRVLSAHILSRRPARSYTESLAG
eukprot:2918291-Rhodomonas_salina.4